MINKIIRLSSVLLLLVLTNHSLFAQEINVGDEISKLEVEQYLQAPQENYTFDELKGKALLLEFWATWCAPCIASMPHLNKLSREYSEQPIRFISITAERESIVAHFLERHKIEGWIGLDTDWSVHEKLNVYAIPKTVLIYPSGKVAAITRADKVSSKTIDKLIAGAPLDIMEEKANNRRDNREYHSKGKESQKAVVKKLKEMIKASQAKGEVKTRIVELSSRSSNNGSIKMVGINAGIFFASSISLNELLEIAYKFPPARILGPDSLLNKTFSVSVIATHKKGKEFLKIFQNTLTTSLGLKINRKKKKTDIYILTAPNGIVKGLREYKSKKSHISSASGVIAASSEEISELGKQVEELVNAFVINKTNLDKKYAWTVTYDATNPKSVISAIEDQLGLELQKKQKTVEVMLVSQK